MRRLRARAFAAALSGLRRRARARAAGQAEEMEGTVHVVKLANDETYKRYRVALGKLVDPNTGAMPTRLAEVLFGVHEPHVAAARKDAATGTEGRSFAPMNSGLNASQLDAIEFALNASDLALIHGPPGTGKTTTVVEYIRQEVARGRRVLACAPSNVAVDNIAERLAAGKVRIVRLGHPARLLDSVVEHSLDVQVMRSDSKELAQDARAELNAILKKLGSRKVDKADRFRMRGELTALRKEVTALALGLVSVARRATPPASPYFQ